MVFCKLIQDCDSVRVDVTDEAVNACPVGAILKKRVGFEVPVGQRTYDHKPIGSEIEATKACACEGGCCE